MMAGKCLISILETFLVTPLLINYGVMKILMPPSGLIILSDINAKKYIFTNIDGGLLNCGASAFQDTLPNKFYDCRYFYYLILIRTYSFIHEVKSIYVYG